MIKISPQVSDVRSRLRQKTSHADNQSEPKNDPDQPKRRCSVPIKATESVDCEKIHATGAKPIKKSAEQTAAKSTPATVRMRTSIPPDR